jgi:predicted outer membrane repeat protein
MAVIQANNDGGTITFAPSITTVTLTSSLPNIVKDTTITGGSDNVTITAGAPDFRFVGVDGSAGGLDVTLDHLSITGFDTDALNYGNGRGAVLYVGGATGNTIAISDCVISINEGNNVIDATGGLTSLSITRSTFEDNTATAGGYAYGVVDFRNSSPLTVTDSTFSNNSADGGGGAIFDQGVHVTTITGSTFIGNSSLSGSAASRRGGAVYSYDASLVISDSTFSGNSAYFGGAIFTTRDALITRSSFYNNSADGAGAIAADASVTLVNSFVGHNHSTNSNISIPNRTGGVWTGADVILQFSTVYANSVAGGAPSQIAVVGNLRSTASVIAAGPGSGGSAPIYSNNPVQYSYTVVTGPSAYPSPVPISSSSPGYGFKVGPGQVGLETLPPSPSASPGRLGQAPLPTSVVYTAAPTANPLPSASPAITADQVGAPRPNRGVGASAWTIGSRQLAAGTSPSPSASPTSTSSPSPSSSPTVAPAPSPESGGASASTPSASASSTVFVPTPEAVGSSLAPGGSSLLVDGRPATGLVVAPNGSANELEARGPGFTMTVQGQSTGGRPVALGQSGALRVGTGGRVESRGTGFRSGSQVGVFVDPSTTPTRLRKTPRAAGTSVGTLTVNGLGAFDGTVTLPANLAPGSHVLQIVGQAPDGDPPAQ